MLKEVKIEHILEKVDQIPTIPSLALKIDEVIQKPTSSAQDLAEVISHDMAISSKILRIVNSAYYNFDERIDSLQHAISILGFDLVKNLTLGIASINTFKQHSKFGFDRNQLWLHSLAVAFATQTLAKMYGGINAEKTRQLFTIGILHDIGKVITECYFPDQFTTILKLANKRKQSYCEVESEVMGKYTHQVIGAVVAQRWSLPEVINNCFMYHHVPGVAPEKHKEMAAIVHVANLTAEIVRIGNNGTEFTSPIDENVYDILSITEKDIKDLSIGLFEMKDAIHAMIGQLTE